MYRLTRVEAKALDDEGPESAGDGGAGADRVSRHQRARGASMTAVCGSVANDSLCAERDEKVDPDGGRVSQLPDLVPLDLLCRRQLTNFWVRQAARGSKARNMTARTGLGPRVVAPQPLYGPLALVVVQEARNGRVVVKEDPDDYSGQHRCLISQHGRRSAWTWSTRHMGAALEMNVQGAVTTVSRPTSRKRA